MVQGLLAASLFVAGWIVFPGSFLLQKYFWFDTSLGKRISQEYGFSGKDCVDISNKVVSAFQAVLATISGFIVCSNCYQNVLYDAHPMTLLYAWFGIPYFLYDTFAMFYVSRIEENKRDDSHIVIQFIKFILRSPVIVIHHMILAPLGFSLIVFFRDGIRNGDFFVGIIYLMETSTPFVSLRFILSKFKLKSSSMYLLNGILMLVMFPIFRIASCFYTVSLYAEQNGLGFLETLLQIPLGWKLVFSSAVAPQIYWYFLMCKGLIRMIQKSKAQNDIDKKEKSSILSPPESAYAENGTTMNSLDRPKIE